MCSSAKQKKKKNVYGVDNKRDAHIRVFKDSRSPSMFEKKTKYSKKGKTWQKKGCVTSNLLVSYTFLAFSDNFMKVLIFKKGRKKTLGSGTGPNIRLKDALRHDSNRTQYKAKRCLDTWFKHDPI